MSSHDVFNRGVAYEPYVGRWSRRMAPEFVQWIGAAPGSRWLDVGCGTGALTEAIMAVAQPSKVVGIDPSAEFVEFAKDAFDDRRASFYVGNAMRLQFEAAEFDAAAAALVLNFVPEPAVAVAEMRRVVRPGGSVAAYVWDYAGEMRMMRYFWDAAVELDLAAAELDEGVRFKICNPAALRSVFESAGLGNVAMRPLISHMKFADFDDYWNPFLGGQAPAPAYAMSLDDERRNCLRDLIRSRLPLEMDSRAWAIKGRVA